MGRTFTFTFALRLVVHLVLLKNSRPHPWLILEENGRLSDNEDDDEELPELTNISLIRVQFL